MKKWLLRLLVLFAVLTAMVLFGLKIVSGTSDTHKRGLEQAFSQIFEGQASFGSLKQFNLIPQFAIEIENLQILNVKGNGNLIAEHFLIAFGPIDLMTKSRLIENFNIQNMRLTEGLYTPLALTFTDMGIYPNGDEAKLSFKGSYGAQNVSGEFAMGVKSGTRPKYFFNDQNAFTIAIGPGHINGLFLPYATGGAKVSQVELIGAYQGKQVQCVVRDGKEIEFSVLVNDILTKAATAKTPQDLYKLCGL